MFSMLVNRVKGMVNIQGAFIQSKGWHTIGRAARYVGA